LLLEAVVANTLVVVLAVYLLAMLVLHLARHIL
jgi:hypothetical protein